MSMRPSRVSLREVNEAANDLVGKEDSVVVVKFGLGKNGRATDSLAVIEICPLLSYLLQHVLADERVMHVSS